MTKWDERFLSTAAHYASFSKDPSTKVGAVCVRDNRVVSAGWNGFPRGFPDDRMEDREYKYKFVVHAEMNCILNAAREGTSLMGTTMYVDGLRCCSKCALAIAQSGVERVVMRVLQHKIEAQNWSDEFAIAGEIFRAVGIDYSTQVS